MSWENNLPFVLIKASVQPLQKLKFYNANSAKDFQFLMTNVVHLNRRQVYSQVYKFRCMYLPTFWRLYFLFSFSVAAIHSSWNCIFFFIFRSSWKYSTIFLFFFYFALCRCFAAFFPFFFILASFIIRRE